MDDIIIDDETSSQLSKIVADGEDFSIREVVVQMVNQQNLSAKDFKHFMKSLSGSELELAKQFYNEIIIIQKEKNKLSKGRSLAKSSHRKSGTIKFFNHDRGFGFITPENGDRDVFVHVTAFERAGLPLPREGQKVTFVSDDDDSEKSKINIEELFDNKKMSK